MRRAAIILVLLAATACAESERSDADGPNCAMCHVYSELSTARSNVPAKHWAQAAGGGLTRKDVLIALDHWQFAYHWPRRGAHDAVDLADCSGCHPVSREGIRHGVSQYSPAIRELVFAGGADCAAACHGWLPAEGTAAGFIPAAGPAPQITGSFRPADLLAGAANRHAGIYNRGYRSGPSAELRITMIKPGCGGCHNAREEAHGAIVGCLDCHLFGTVMGERHQSHVQRISLRRAELDPGHADREACTYCHAFEDDPDGLARGACYNCHLSGHQPLDGEHTAHFWTP